jgi:hypothetical protein
MAVLFIPGSRSVMTGKVRNDENDLRSTAINKSSFVYFVWWVKRELLLTERHSRYV